MNVLVHLQGRNEEQQTKHDVNALLSDLGKATRRGVKKCPNCGYLNGTRGFVCKNSICNLTFKETDKRKLYLDSIKLYTGTRRQIYSVRVRDKGPEHRGFVQLPFYDSGEPQKRIAEVALCFVDSCQRLFDDSILKCHENDANTATLCAHIKSALKSYSIALGLDFKHELINGLRVADEIKKRLCLLAKSCDGPVVQRVSKNVFAVKCAVTPTNPLGYLHLLLKGCDNLEKFYCNCVEAQQVVLLHHNDVTHHQQKQMNKCMHYYACICAFASTLKFAQKYASMIRQEFDTTMSTTSTTFQTYESQRADATLHIAPAEAVAAAAATSVTTLTKKQHINLVENNFIYANVEHVHNKQTHGGRKERANVLLSFGDWLASIIETINACLSIDNEKEFRKIFHIHNKFYDYLCDRINTTTKESQRTLLLHTRNKPPYGTYTKHIWKIKNLTEINKIFNEKIQLHVKKLYCNLPNSTYVECVWPKCIHAKHMLLHLCAPMTIEWTLLYPQSEYGELELIINRKLMHTTNCSQFTIN